MHPHSHPPMALVLVLKPGAQQFFLVPHLPHPLVSGTQVPTLTTEQSEPVYGEMQAEQLGPVKGVLQSEQVGPVKGATHAPQVGPVKGKLHVHCCGVQAEILPGDAMEHWGPEVKHD